MIFGIQSCAKKTVRRPLVDWHVGDYKTLGITNGKNNTVHCTDPKFKEYTCIHKSDYQNLLHYIIELEEMNFEKMGN